MPQKADLMQPSSTTNNNRKALMNLSAIINRIEETVDAETAAIRTDIRFDIKASNVRKGRYLYELNKAIAGLGTTELDISHRDDGHPPARETFGKRSSYPRSLDRRLGSR